MQLLATTQEHPNDILLVHFIRLQLLAENVERAPWSDAYVESSDLIKTPAHFYLKALQSQLQALKTSVAPHLQQSRKFLLLQRLSDSDLLPSCAMLVSLQC